MPSPDTRPGSATVTRSFIRPAPERVLHASNQRRLVARPWHVMVGPRTPVASPVIMCTGRSARGACGRARTCDVPDVPTCGRAGRAGTCRTCADVQERAGRERAERCGTCRTCGRRERADWVEGGRASLRRATSMTARYGEPLPLDLRDVFIDQAPEGVRPQVAVKLARVRFQATGDHPGHHAFPPHVRHSRRRGRRPDIRRPGARSCRRGSRGRARCGGRSRWQS